MSAPAHTPTPWQLATHAATVLGPVGEAIAALESRGTLGRKDAAHIVKCVNERDGLLDALEEALGFIERHIGVDVVDGAYGEPKPDRAMQVAMMLKRTLDKVQA